MYTRGYPRKILIVVPSPTAGFCPAARLARDNNILFKQPFALQPSGGSFVSTISMNTVEMLFSTFDAAKYGTTS